MPISNLRSHGRRLRLPVLGVTAFATFWFGALDGARPQADAPRGAPNAARADASSAARPQADAPIAYRLLALDVGGRSRRMHRFRVQVARMRAEVFDLGFKVPIAGWLGDSSFAVNGGYWEYHLGKPRMIGWVVSRGKQLSPLRKKLDGGVLLVRDARAQIVKSSALDPKPAGIELAVQCKPRLVEAGKVVPQLHTTGTSTRTAVCTRDAGATLDVFLSDPRELGPTLAELGHWLAAQGCSDALNLDGGPSTAASFRAGDGVMQIGTGVYLPYAIRFFPR